MAALKNPRRERLAQELAKGKTKTEAMQVAGYSDPRNSTRLTNNDEIARRVDELQERVAKKAEVTLETLTQELDEARNIAIELGQPSAMVAATREKAILLGIRVEKRESVHKADPKAMTDDELALIACGGSPAIARQAPRKGVTH